MRGWLVKRTRKLWAGAAVGGILGLAAAAVAWSRPAIVERAEFWTYDVRARHAAAHGTPSPEVVLIDISEQDIADADRNYDVTWPWPREMYAHLTRYVATGKPKAIIFDWLFIGRGSSVNDAAIFADALRGAGRTVLAFFSSQTAPTGRPLAGRWVVPLATFPTRAEAERAAAPLLALARRVFLSGPGPTTVLLGATAAPDEVLADWERLATADELAALFRPAATTAAGAPPGAPGSAGTPDGKTTGATPPVRAAGVTGTTPRASRAAPTPGGAATPPGDGPDARTGARGAAAPDPGEDGDGGRATVGPDELAVENDPSADVPGAAARKNNGAGRAPEPASATTGPGAAEPPPIPPPPTPRQLTDEELADELTDETLLRRSALALPVEAGVAAGVRRQRSVQPPLALLAGAADHLGNVVQSPEEDGVLRRYAPIVEHAGRLYPSLALAAWLAGHPGVAPRLEGRTLALGDRAIPLDDEGRFAIRYHGGDEAYRHVSAYKLIRSSIQVESGDIPEIPADIFKDKYVIVSATAAAMVDVRPSPVARRHQGAAINAAALDNLLDGHVVRRTSREVDAALAFALAFLLAVVLVAVWGAIRSSVGAIVATAATGALCLGGYLWAIDLLFVTQGLWAAAVVPTTGAAVATFSSLLVTSVRERRDRRFVQEALGRYTSRALADELVNHPEYLSLGGTRRDVSILFSDIAEFTSISEGLAPERLVALLNEYLTVMTDIVDRHGGYVDKYIGDAIMAFWGGLLPDERHAEKAVLAALAMGDACETMVPRWREQYGIELAARAGVNSGPAVVGNMGSRAKYNYTAMGDTVNVASRLEGANKPYGTLLLVSGETYERVKDVVEARELDLLAVKGKEHPIVVYEVLAEKGKLEPLLRAVVIRFAEALALYRAQRFAEARVVFRRILDARPDDGPARAYVARCEHLLEHPPGPGWDGVWHMKEK